jgi:hypothetical protein
MEIVKSYSKLRILNIVLKRIENDIDLILLFIIHRL